MSRRRARGGVDQGGCDSASTSLADVDGACPVRRRHAGAGGVRLMLFGAASGPVPPIDPRRLNAAGSEYLTRPLRTNFNRTYDEFSWRAQELFDAPGVASTSRWRAVPARGRRADAPRSGRPQDSRLDGADAVGPAHRGAAVASVTMSGSCSGCRLVARTQPVRTSANAATFHAVNGSCNTITPAARATAGLM